MDNKINYVIHLTKRCNWTCEYCIVDTHNAEFIPLDDVMFKINNLPKNAIVNLSGGEPGSLSYRDMDQIITKLVEKECEININTNGLFIKKFKIYDKYISNYFYHLSENLIDIPYINYLNKDILSKTEPMIVVTDNNIVNLKDFVDMFIIKFPHKKLIIYKSDSEKFGLSLKNLQYIVKNFKYIIDDKYYSYLLIGAKTINKNNKFKVFMNR